MKLSQMSTDKALDVMCELTPYVTEIVTDDVIFSKLQEGIDGEKANTLAAKIAVLGKVISSLLPRLLKDKRHCVYGIIGIMCEKPVEEIAAQPLTETVKQAKEIFADKELLDFFRSCASSEGSE